MRPFEWNAPYGHTHATVALAAFTIMVAGLEAAVLIFYGSKQTSLLRIRVTDPHDQGASVAGYLATYLLPLLSVSVHSWNIATAYGIYFVILYVIFVRSDGLVLINPTLYLFGFRIFDVQLAPMGSITDVGLPEVNRRVLLIARTGVRPPATVSVVALGDDCYLSSR